MYNYNKDLFNVSKAIFFMGQNEKNNKIQTHFCKKLLMQQCRYITTHSIKHQNRLITYIHRRLTFMNDKSIPVLCNVCYYYSTAESFIIKRNILNATRLCIFPVYILPYVKNLFKSNLWVVVQNFCAAVLHVQIHVYVFTKVYFTLLINFTAHVVQLKTMTIILF